MQEQSVSLEQIRAALAELKVKNPSEETLESAAAGAYTRICLETVQVRRCYRTATHLTLNPFAGPGVPKGNGGNFFILEQGVHPLLGVWIKSTCDYDSSD
jgi:hypothetical protein